MQAAGKHTEKVAFDQGIAPFQGPQQGRIAPRRCINHHAKGERQQASEDQLM
jgi:hypothetical protein